MVALEKNTALSVPLEAYGCVFIIATTYPKASVVAYWRGKKKICGLPFSGKLLRLPSQNLMPLVSEYFVAETLSLPRRLSGVSCPSSEL